MAPPPEANAKRAVATSSAGVSRDRRTLQRAPLVSNGDAVVFPLICRLLKPLLLAGPATALVLWALMEEQRLRWASATALHLWGNLPWRELMCTVGNCISARARDAAVGARAGDLSANVSLASKPLGCDEAAGKFKNLCIDGHLAPEFLLIGAMKSATTSFAADLARIPGIRPPERNGVYVKELHFFDRQVHRGRAAWLDHYPSCRQDVRMVAMDATPAYFRSEEAPQYIGMWYGDKITFVRFVVLLRDPWRRIQSEWYYLKDLMKIQEARNMRKRKAPPRWQSAVRKTFQDFIDEEVLSTLDRLDSKRPKLGTDGSERANWEKQSLLELAGIPLLKSSLYAGQFTRYFLTLESAQFTVVPFRFQEHPPGPPGAPSVAQRLAEEIGLQGVDKAEPDAGCAGVVPLEKLGNSFAHRHKKDTTNSRPHPHLDQDLSAASLAAFQSGLLEKFCGSEAVARVLAPSRARLFNFGTGQRNVSSVAAWLVANW